jgi:enoyl-CoA hydratase/carnithine racemase
MSLAIDAVTSVDGIAIVRVVPQPDIDALVDVAACWVALEADTSVRAVAVLSSTDDFSFGVKPDVGVTIAPKRVGLLKPFGVGLCGEVYDFGLQLVADADVVIATHDVLIGDTSMHRGVSARHAPWLQGLVPDLEVERLALLGAASPMTADRAVALGLLEEVVDRSELEYTLVRRLWRRSSV